MALQTFRLDLATADDVVTLVEPRLRARAATRLTGGYNSAAFEVQTTDGRAVVVKIYSDALHWKLAKELFVYGRMQEHALTVRVPTVLAADDSKALLPHNVLVMTKLDGLLLESVADRLDESELVHLNRQIGDIQRRLHEIRFDRFGYVGTDGVVGGHASNLEYMRFQFEKKLREFGELGGDAKLRERIARHVAEREDLLADDAPPCFCHNDCHYGNVLVIPEDGRWRVSGLVDFENVVAGDPLLDLAKTHCFANRRNETTLAALADGHGDLRADWRETLELYVLYHWLELWDWFAALGTGGRLGGLERDIRQAVAA